MRAQGIDLGRSIGLRAMLGVAASERDDAAPHAKAAGR